MSIDNDWLPSVTPIMHLISLKNKLERLNLVCKTIGPLIACFSWIYFTPEQKKIGCVIIIALSWISFIPELLCLRYVLKIRPQLLAASTRTEIQDAMENPFVILYKEFSTFSTQPIMWSTVSFIMDSYCLF